MNSDLNGQIWIPDNCDGTYRNPVIFADYSDPDVIRMGNDFFMTASSFNCIPGLPVLHSCDLVNWAMIGHALKRQPPVTFDRKPRHGKGVWAPSFRYHDGMFLIYYGDPDFGIYRVAAKSPAESWSEPVLVKPAIGWIDPCPFWDDDGNAYIVHAWAKSRVGFNSVLTLRRMNREGTEIMEDSVMIFDGHDNHPTIEGPKMYKHSGYYYIFAPAGGVKSGWQTVLRSKNILGPYESKIVLSQGKTEINGPHQGAWIQLESGESWFIHFQDRDAYGRVVHLQPMEWKDGWPVIGTDPDGDGTGEPVAQFDKPDVNVPCPVVFPQISDEFVGTNIGLQWQWHGNADSTWGEVKAGTGYLKLNAVPLPRDFRNFWDVPNLLLQKFSAPEFIVTVKLTSNLTSDHEKAGLIVMGSDYSYLAVESKGSELYLARATCLGADRGTTELVGIPVRLEDKNIYLRITVNDSAKCDFSYSIDGNSYKSVGGSFTAKSGKWIGAKVGLFCVRNNESDRRGYVTYHYFRVEGSK